MKNKILTSITGRLIVFLALMTFGLEAVTAQTVLNNNKVRIGNGTESSINSSGNMQQPFYYNQTLNLWRKLTFSSYPLDNAFATGGSGTSEWNINGTLVENPLLTGQVIDYSQYVSTGTNMGYGKIISTGNITIGAATLQVEYTYTLGQNSSFIQVKCKVTNVGNATATNVRTWLGTRDDYVGNNDRPTKTRGNLVNGAFATVSSTSVQAKALKIESGVEGVLFYTTHPRAYTSISSCCSFINAINTDPLNSAVSVTSDNSYAMYVRFNDLPVGASDEFSLYYAAGDIADLEEIINEVAQASGAISNITTNSAVFTSSSPAATTGYYVVVPQGATPPTAAQIQAGTNYGSTVVANSGTAAMAANASVTYNLTGLAPSTPYTLYFVSYNGTAYSTIYNANFTTLAPLTATMSSSTNLACNGGTSGAATVTAAGANPPYTYLWSNGATTATVTGLAAGTYTVTVTDSNNQTATQTVTITQPAALVASPASQTNVSCNGGSNGSAAVAVTGGTGSYTYSWAPSGGTAAAATGLAAGTYTVTVTDANGCEATQNFTITQPTALAASADTQTNVSCNSGSNGSASVAVTGGTGTYTYSWSPSGGTAATATGLAAGTYTVTVTDANGCEATQSFIITQPTALTATADTQTNVFCNGGSNGSASVAVAGGTGTYTYSWSPSGGTAAAATGLIAGTYTVTVTDANGCQATQSFTITQPSALSATTSASNVSCPGHYDGTAAINVTGGTAPYTYVWNNGGVTNVITGLTAGVYVVNVTDANGCQIEKQVFVNTTPDTTAPTPNKASLPTITKQCAVTAADIPVPTANDNCAGTVIATTTDELIYTDQGTYTITWTYNDRNGNRSTQLQTVIVKDVTKPIPAVASLPTITKQCAVTAADIPVPTANDNCAGIITATTTDALAYTAQGTYTINWTYNDGNGNTTIQQQTIIVDDVTVPVPTVATLPTITKECAVTAADIPVPTANDNCVGIISATTTDALAYTEQGTYTINWTYNDGNGNTTTQQQTIVVDDVTAPVPTVVTLPTITKECAVTAADIPVPTANDNCVGIISATTTDALAYTEQGTYTINWTYNDGNGNTVTQLQTVIVKDVTKPIPAVASLPTITRECAVTPADIPVPTANDNCVGIISATTTDALTYTEQGTYTINWTYNDGNGNMTTQQQTIVVDDVTSPVPTVATLPTITKECAVTAVDIPVPTAIDNCAGTITATTTDALVYTAQGTYTINWTYNDGNGNTATQQQTIVVDDVTAPVPTVATLPTITKECTVTAADIPVPTANDNCVGIISATTTDALTYTEQGTYTINWTYNDGNGNTYVQQQTVIVEESPLAAIVLNDLTTVYDSTVHNLMVANMPAGAAVSYSIAPQAEEDNGAVNAGTYTVTAVVTPPASAVNCEPVTLTAELVIEKAAQNIQFDELEVVLLETAADFQLDATASSGLPVTYTYTYDQSTPAATVSPEGWVEILHSGSVLITAHQQGDSNYLPAASVERSLIIESKDASIQQIVVNGVVYTDPDAVIYYMLDCNDTTNEVPVQIDAEFGATVSPARDFVIGIPKPGVYRNTVEVVSEDGTNVQRYQIIVERPFAFDDIVVQKFNNTLLINNNPQTNGGYRFVKYEWYRNDVLIGTEQVYSAGNSKQDILDENALYRAVLTTENGDVIHTCASEITRTNNFKINVYPNPVRVNEQLQVVFDYPSAAFKGASASLYTTSGKLLQSVKLNEKVSSVQLPAGLSEGIYMLVLQIEGRQETVKVVVKQ
ncbi:Por secretion system C-terminal sorting domain-containing protein [Paenimyroides ummariense]|uniref:Por secretion system C-terminal sorting domain-containing protein n=1 Tax=Paenimyroides ummariense TaxID=913024 RepID=A0A1I5DSP9_9FLAO|nr:T9SS type A sorting domain-containing protein [Paenimyroides ummariense]SFO02238.1 Por secretion system C-terminal sorting domain-containing protein [Paenimyroides ummariense]